MKGHRFVLILIVSVVLAGIVPTRGSIAAQLPPEVRTTTNAGAVRQKIEDFLKPKVADLSGTDTAAQSAAREAIIGEVQSTPTAAPAIGAAPVPTSGSQVSAAFLDAYADVLAEQLKPLAASQDPRVQLNAAIVAARVTERANNSRLMPVVVDLLGAQNEAVALWAVKASKFLLPSLLNSNATARSNPLVPAFSDAVKKNINSAALVQSAYEALRINQGTGGVSSSAWPTAVQVVAPIIQDIVSMRLDQYKQAIPEQPRNETIAMTFLTEEKVWKAQSEKTQLRTVQLDVNLIGLAAQRAVGKDVVEGQELHTVVHSAAGGLSVVGQWIGQQSLMDAAVKSLADIKPGTPAEEMLTRANALVPALNKIKAFANIQPFPKIQG